MSLSRFYAIAQIEYCRNFIFKRHFPIHKVFERSCEIGLWRWTANRSSEIFGVRLNKRLHGKLATVIDQIEPGHHVFRAYWKNAFLQQYEKFSCFLRNELCSNNLRDLGPEERARSSRRRTEKIPDHHGPFRWIPGPVPQCPCGFSSTAAACPAHHHRLHPPNRRQHRSPPAHQLAAGSPTRRPHRTRGYRQTHTLPPPRHVRPFTADP